VSYGNTAETVENTWQGVTDCSIDAGLFCEIFGTFPRASSACYAMQARTSQMLQTLMRALIQTPLGQPFGSDIRK